MLTGLEKKLAEEQVFQVEDLVLLRDEGMLQTVFSKHVTRRKVEMALDRRALQASGQQAGVQRAGSEPRVSPAICGPFFFYLSSPTRRALPRKKVSLSARTR